MQSLSSSIHSSFSDCELAEITIFLFTEGSVWNTEKAFLFSATPASQSVVSNDAMNFNFPFHIPFGSKSHTTTLSTGRDNRKAYFPFSFFLATTMRSLNNQIVCLPASLLGSYCSFLNSASLTIRRVLLCKLISWKEILIVRTCPLSHGVPYEPNQKCFLGVRAIA